ncbi:hypothetical protein GCM10011399_15780 [Subtercola lobariae]|uniref:Uncharacterized protein n=1 Tax=Subtercola lobariae TaxID=1588641 RepID=A0A917EVZ4_9MICO|nr:hypothetical protein GCM10011399_15780 [Subtercola lobariae]
MTRDPNTHRNRTRSTRARAWNRTAQSRAAQAYTEMFEVRVSCGGHTPEHYRVATTWRDASDPGYFATYLNRHQGCKTQCAVAATRLATPADDGPSGTFRIETDGVDW